ncbi:alpha/beta fold hydrolase [Labrys wisconsinensis]|uniref:Dienelactone hydrolase n=1 Tax=Labrys wisconsinensis TaxID=425677 RepID=A0ABU0JAN2_9HYPH|nr:alpha/beta fold hydrolase [Labrys wisconsinensis]MDQ0470670.1 dienelactone hydrolase [Labrys wisconsinensis]
MRNLFAALVAVPLAMLPVTGRATDFVEDHSYFRVIIGGKPVRLEGLTIKRSDAAGRLPIALVVHGKPLDTGDVQSHHTNTVEEQARDLAGRGWLAVVPMHRGFGQSDGLPPGALGCDVGALLHRFSDNADDLEAVLALVKQRPDADPSRVIAIGVSAGGADVVTLSARNPAGLLGVVSISGGLRLDNCPAWQDNLVAAEKSLGAQSRVPQLWLYARNDSYFGPDLVDRMRSAALDGGADVKLVMFDPIGTDGHSLFSVPSGRNDWLRELDAFLRYLKLPTWQLGEVDAILTKIRAQKGNRGFIESYFAAPLYKALAYSPSQNNFWDGFGATSLERARTLALEPCKRKASDCAIVMENDDAVPAQPAGSTVGSP